MTITDSCPTCKGKGQVIRHYERMSRWEVCCFCDGNGQNKPNEDNKKQLVRQSALNPTEEEATIAMLN